jgi:FkbM family methyltransferase
MERPAMKPARLFKYRILQAFPGGIGRRYREKYQRNAHRDAFARALKKTRHLTAIDLGANIGEYTVKMADAAREVIAFEPDPWALEELRASVAGRDNVRIIAAAAGIEDGVVHFYRHADFEADRVLNSQSGTLIAEKNNIDASASIEVEQVDFLRFLRALDRDVGVLKIDIEGAEVDLLERLMQEPELLDRIHYIFAETHETKIPGHVPRVEALRAAAARLGHPVINLNWH